MAQKCTKTWSFLIHKKLLFFVTYSSQKIKVDGLCYFMQISVAT